MNQHNSKQLDLALDGVAAAQSAWMLEYEDKQKSQLLKMPALWIAAAAFALIVALVPLGLFASRILKKPAVPDDPDGDFIVNPDGENNIGIGFPDGVLRVEIFSDSCEIRHSHYAPNGSVSINGEAVKNKTAFLQALRALDGKAAPTSITDAFAPSRHAFILTGPGDSKKYSYSFLFWEKDDKTGVLQINDGVTPPRFVELTEEECAAFTASFE